MVVISTIGYVYITENMINHRMYIGKHLSEHYDSSYLGSGKILKQAIKKYGKENFSNKILYKADTLDELNAAEIKYIQMYHKQYGNQMYNIATGGDGGNVFAYATSAQKENFIQKMTEINKARCSSDSFKQKISIATSKRFEDENERRKQSYVVKTAWSNQDLRKAQSERLLKYYKTHTRDNSCFCKQCILEFDGDTYIFESRKKLEQFLKSEYNLTMNHKLMTKLLRTGNPYIPFHKNRLQRFIGMRMYYKQQNENVETIGDECSRVGREIGTRSKCKTEIEDIVQPA